MKKVIIGSLAVVGGITLAVAGFVGTIVAIETAKAKRKYAKMTPEEREAENAKVKAVLDVIMGANNENKEPYTEEEVEDIDAAREETAPV